MQTMTVALGLGVTVTHVSVGVGREEDASIVAPDYPRYLPPLGTTVTLKGQSRGGGYLEVSATAFGPDGRAAAGWRAFHTLVTSNVPVDMSASERWVRFGADNWRQTECSWPR